MSSWRMAPTHHININRRILQNMISGIPLYWTLEPECEILMFLWFWGSEMYVVLPSSRQPLK